MKRVKYNSELVPNRLYKYNLSYGENKHREYTLLTGASADIYGQSLEAQIIDCSHPRAVDIKFMEKGLTVKWLNRLCNDDLEHNYEIMYIGSVEDHPEYFL